MAAGRKCQYERMLRSSVEFKRQLLAKPFSTVFRFSPKISENHRTANLPAGIGSRQIETNGSQRRRPAMGLADSTVGLDAGKRLRLSKGHRKQKCSLGTRFDFVPLNTSNPWSIPIRRRQFLVTGLATRLVAAANNVHQGGVDILFPVSMDRCVVVNGRSDRLSLPRLFTQSYGTPEHSEGWVGMFPDEASPWSCKLVLGVRGYRVQDWWLIVSLHENCRPQLTVLHISSSSPCEVGMTGLLVARITFRLHALQRRGVFHDEFNKYHVVRKVNQQILRAMDKMPA